MIQIDYSRDALLSEQSLKLLAEHYLHPGERPQDGFAAAAIAWATFRGVTDWALAQRLYDYASKGWFGWASPPLSNAPRAGKPTKALPISCFAGAVEDTLESLVAHDNELKWLSIMGGGVGGHWDLVRSVDRKAPGPIPFIVTADATVRAYKQGAIRRGSYAAYLSVSHPDIREFIGLRLPAAAGDSNRKCLSTGFHHAVNITDDFMRAVIEGKSWDLIDPHHGDVRETVDAAELFAQILETRARTGEPYLNFIDTANRHLPEAQKKLGLKILGSNLCDEIHLATGRDIFGKMRTLVCCLSSLNIEKRDEWLPVIWQFVGDLITALDNIIEYFIEHAPDTIATARYSAMRERALGLGTMGIHAYLQSKGIPWESWEAVELDERIHAEIKAAAEKRSLELGAERGEAPDMVGTGRRNSHLLSIAPTANNASIVGTSPGIDPWKANAFAHRTRVGTHLVKNRHLEARLEQLGRNTDEVWQDIMLNRGSVQHLDFLTERDRAVFKTAIELDQMWVVQHAAARQKHICQGQSLNLFFAPGTDRKHVANVHIAAWALGCKGLYYYRTEARNKADTVSKSIERVALKDAVAGDDCISCQG
ncbi:ribonucleoside-diphosphate reductase subunit alpha [Azospirillum sp. Sh1]|uniref:ribonucleoside-diphosphate reductase subunit alpha n=1 Tax=Azospirillum sp. Sh1 TaxID=2607285 RepID=UPI0011ED266B|nr:ribonucleoside-diphosphate reductase subunit alpha [Azospirillum sp. Sh1]KAA0573436.1 ribonucleoside-diphosphate reductase subunit alpha [Azospirillum sp. Sh1]